MKYSVGLILTLIMTAGCYQDKNKFSINNRKFCSIKVLDTFSIVHPIKRITYRKPFFYSYNFVSKQIHKHDNNFNFLDSLGSQGDALYENSVVLNYSIIDEERVGIIDSEKNIFKIQDWEDSVHSYYRFPDLIERGVHINDSTAIITQTHSDDLRLSFYKINLRNGSSEPLTQLNKMLDEPLSYFTHEGKLMNFENTVYSFSYLYTDFIKMDTDKLKAEKMMYGYDIEVKKPKVMKFSGGYATGENPLYILDAALTESHIYILSNFSTLEYSSNRILDIYSHAGFNYIRSYVLPNLDNYPPSEIFHDDQYLYLNYENYILKSALSNCLSESTTTAL